MAFKAGKKPSKSIREYYAHLRQSKAYDEGSAAFAQRRKPEYSKEYYDEKTRPAGVPDPVK